MAVTTVQSPSNGENNLPQLLKRKYGKLQPIFNAKSLAYNRLKTKDNIRFSHRDFLFPVFYALQSGVGYYGEMEDLPDAGTEDVRDAMAAIIRIAGSVQFTGQFIESGKDPDSGFANTLQFKMENCLLAMARKLNIGIYGFHQRAIVGGGAPASPGVNGVRAQVLAGGGGLTLTLNKPLGYTTAMGIANMGGARYLNINEVVTWGTIVGVTYTFRSSGRITAIDYQAQTITVTNTGGGAAPVNGDWIVPGTTAAKNDYGKALSGLGILHDQADDGNGVQVYENLPITANNPTAWSNYSKAAAAGVLDLQDMHNIVTSISRVGQGETSMILADPSFIELYTSLLSPDVRYEPQVLEGGYRTLKFASGNNIDIVFDKDCPYGVLNYVDERAIFWLKQRDLAWDETDKKIIKFVPQKDQWFMFAKGYMNMGITKLNSHGVLKGLTVPQQAM